MKLHKLVKLRLKNLRKRIKYFFVYLIYKNDDKYIKLFWSKGRKINFGDSINPKIFNFLTQKKVIFVEPKFYPYKHYIGIGSIIDYATSNSIICSSGIISKKEVLKIKPENILSVRGKITRESLIKNNIDCPELYGDLAILYKKIYNPTHIKKKYKLGIIPHYIDKDSSIIDKFKANYQDVVIIDIQSNCFESFIDTLISCDVIASSSLHGIIMADVYGIKNIWIKITNKLSGDGIKFYDYFSSVNRNEKQYILKETSEMNDLLNNVNDTDILNLDKDIEKIYLYYKEKLI